MAPLTPPPSPWRRFYGMASIGFFSVLPAFATAGSLALAPLLGVAGALSLRPSVLFAAMARPHPALVLALLFSGWAVLSTLWAPLPDSQRALKLAFGVATGALFIASAGADPGMRRLTPLAALAAAIVLLGLLAIEALFGAPLNRAADPGALDWEVALNPGRGASAMLAIVWGAAGALLLRITLARVMLALALIVAAAATASQFEHNANAVGAVVGVLTFAVAMLAPGAAIRAVTLILALWIAAAPVATPLIFANQRIVDMLPFSWASRVEAWKYICARIAEQPWIGHGADAGRAIRDTIVLRGVETRLVPTHPHSASLQIWHDTGVIGAALAAAALILCGRALARATAHNRAAGAAAAATFASLGFMANVSYSLWQEWWLAAMLTAAALIAALANRKAGED